MRLEIHRDSSLQHIRKYIWNVDFLKQIKIDFDHLKCVQDQMLLKNV